MGGKGRASSAFHHSLSPFSSPSRSRRITMDIETMCLDRVKLRVSRIFVFLFFSGNEGYIDLTFRASFLIPPPLVYRCENFPLFYHSIEYFKKSYIIDLFSLAASSYKACANNFIRSFIPRVKCPDIAGDNVLVDEYTLKKKKKEKKFFLTLNIRSFHPTPCAWNSKTTFFLSSLLFAKIVSSSHRLEKPPASYPRKGGRECLFEIEIERERDANTWNVGK